MTGVFFEVIHLQIMKIQKCLEAYKHHLDLGLDSIYMSNLFIEVTQGK